MRFEFWPVVSPKVPQVYLAAGETNNSWLLSKTNATIYIALRVIDTDAIEVTTVFTVVEEVKVTLALSPT